MRTSFTPKTQALNIRTCPVCLSISLSEKMSVMDPITKESFHVAHCNECQFEFLSNPPPPENIFGYYDNAAGRQMNSSHLGFISRMREFAFQKELGPLLNILERGMSLADLGPGDGSLCLYLKKRGYAPKALDFHPEDQWRLKAVPYRQCNLNGGYLNVQDLQFGGSPVKAVILRHVLEHLYSPRQVFKTFSDAGVEYISLTVPNHDSTLRKICGRYWPYWDPPRHVSYFTLQNLVICGAQAGYSLIDSGFYGIDEVCLSVYRWLSIKFPGRFSAFSENLVGPRSLLTGLSSIISAPLFNTALWACFKKTV